MTEIRFYHLQNRPQHHVLPLILSKALEKGHRILVKMPDERTLKDMNDHLWTFHPDSFLPHGAANDDHTERQPILLTTTDENLNDADLLIICQGAQSDKHGDFKLCCEMLDGQDKEAIAAARERWKVYKEQKFDVTYWQQNEAGGWENKA